jgi:type IV pilus assembly protein PilO
MAGRDLLGELSRKPLGFKVGLLAGVLAVLGLFYWQFLYSGAQDSLQQAKNKNKQLRDGNARLKSDKKEWDTLVLQQKELKEELTRNKVSLPEASELPSFFFHLQKQAAGAGIKVNNWARLKESPVDKYVKVPVKMEIVGTFYQVNNYFKLLYETDRIITVEDLTLAFQGSDNEEIKVKASFEASTFRLPDGVKNAPPEVSGQDQDAVKGGKGAVKDANDKRADQLDKSAGTSDQGPKTVAPPAKGANPTAPTPQPKPEAN